MKFSYSVKNLRRLASTPSIEIRPITILVGRNSVGKSTYLRSFPLLRQSVETKSSAPILWYGDYVDFGNYRSAVTDKDINRTIEFGFEILNYEATSRSSDPFSSRYTTHRAWRRNFKVDHLKVYYGVGSQLDSTERKYIRIELPRRNSCLYVEFDKSNSFATSVKINNLPLSDLFSNNEIYFPEDSLFSAPLFLKKLKEKKRTSLISRPQHEIFLSQIERELSGLVDGRTRAC